MKKANTVRVSRKLRDAVVAKLAASVVTARLLRKALAESEASRQSWAEKCVALETQLLAAQEVNNGAVEALKAANADIAACREEINDLLTFKPIVIAEAPQISDRMRLAREVSL